MRSPCLDAILGPGGLSVLFQPIVEIHPEGPRLHAVESLVRGPRGTNMEPPQVLFEYVRRKREEPRVDRACVTAVCEAVGALPAGLPFSINVHAATLSKDPEFMLHLVDCASRHSIEPSRITIEIVEHAPEWADRIIEEALDAARHIGVRIDLDDIGLGQANYRMMLDCKPDYSKIDRYFVAGCHADF